MTATLDPAALKAENELLRQELKVAREAADITAELVVKQFEETEKMLQRVQAANAAKGDFLARMSHEIRTPMNGIIGMSHLLQKTPLDPRQASYISRVLSSAETLLKLINDILDFSKIDAGKLELEKIPFDLNEVLKNLNDLTSLQVEEKGLKLRFIIAPEVPRKLIGDALRLGQILSNLTSNAIKFTETGEIVISIKLDVLYKHDVKLQFSVCDSGIGLAPERIEHLFGAFHQADDTTTRKYGGTGLGLAICKELVEMMGGRIRAESEPGRGADFIFTAYFGLAHNTAAEPVRTRRRTITRELGSTPEPHLQGVKVLLIDDNSINREVAAAFLHEAGITVEIADNGRKGVAIALSKPFDLVLMDIQMPELDGLEATRQIRRKIDARTLPIVAMTAHATNKDREKSLKAGMNEHLNKPIEPSELYEIINQLIPKQPARLKTTNQPLDEAGKKRSAEQCKQNLPTIPGLNYDTALSHTNYKPELILRLLKDFKTNFSDTAEKLKNYYSTNNNIWLLELLHTLKGVTRYIGANSLNRLTIQLEDSLKSGDPHNSSDDNLLEQLSQQLTTLLAAIPENPSPITPTATAENNNLSQTTTPHNPAETIKELEFLQSKLIKSEHIPNSCIHQLNKLTLIPKISDATNKVIALIEDIEYESAESVISELIEKLKSIQKQDSG